VIRYQLETGTVANDTMIECRFKQSLENDFAPGFGARRIPTIDERTLDATQYAAHQLGQINKKLDRLIAVFERLAAGSSTPP
jgi:hypothetical protein